MTLKLIYPNRTNNNQTDPTFYVDWDGVQLVAEAYGRYGIYRVGYTEIIYLPDTKTSRRLRYSSDLHDIGIHDDDTLLRYSDERLDWVNNSWFEVWDLHSLGNDTDEPFFSIQEAYEHATACWEELMTEDGDQKSVINPLPKDD